VTALHHLTQELDLAGRINRAVSPDEDVQVRDALTVGESPVAAMIARACAPRSKRAFADWAKNTYLPDLKRFAAADLTSQHFWDQMRAVPVEKLAVIEQELVREVCRRGYRQCVDAGQRATFENRMRKSSIFGQAAAFYAPALNR
jgi:hypothetical protein